MHAQDARFLYSGRSRRRAWGGGGGGGGGCGATLFLCQTAKLQQRGQKLFSKLRPCLILETGLVGHQLLKDYLNPLLLLPVFPTLQRMYC